MTGYSFSSNKTAHVKTTPEAAQDVYAFLQLFFRRFEEYATQPFHIAAESYGGSYLDFCISEPNAYWRVSAGHFAPRIASIVHHKNKQLVHTPSSGIRMINLASIMLGNALTDPLI